MVVDSKMYNGINHSNSQQEEVRKMHQSVLCLPCVQTFAANHRLTSEDNELFPSREGSFVRSSGSSFGGRSGSSFTGRLPSRTGPPNLQRFSASVGVFRASVVSSYRHSSCDLLAHAACLHNCKGFLGLSCLRRKGRAPGCLARICRLPDANVATAQQGAADKPGWQCPKICWPLTS
jgi:hypothetical protein